MNHSPTPEMGTAESETDASKLDMPETDTSAPHMPNTPRRFVGAADIHSHPLPGIDDGAATLHDSVAMACLAARYGTNLMVATPHRWYRGRENTPELLLRLTHEVNQALAATSCGTFIRIIAGQEVPLRPETGEEITHRRLLTFGDAGKYVLVEPPFDHLPDWTLAALQHILEVGVIPVFAHPERNADIQRDPTILREVAARGALIQLTAMSVEGFNGEPARSAARWILDNDLATVIASDTHSPTRWRPPTMRGAYHVLRQEYGEPLARRLCITNPTALALSQDLPPTPTPDGGLQCLSAGVRR